jgi:hypothetical protein
MTIRKSLLAALGTVAVAALSIPQAGHAAVTVTIPRPVISIPKVTIPAVKPAITVARPAVSTVKPFPGVKPPVSAKLLAEEANLNKNIAAEKKTVAAETTKVATDEKTIKSEERTLINDLDKGNTKAAQSELNIVEKAEAGLRADETALQKDQAKLTSEQSSLNMLERQIKATPSAAPGVATTPATNAPASVSSTHTPATAPDPNSVPWANVGAATTLDPNVPVPAHTGPAIAAVLNGKPVIKLTEVNGNETTVYYLSRDQKHIVSVISSISTVPPQNVPTAPSSTPAASSGQKVTFTPVSYPEIYDGAGVPLGYVNAQGQSVYFNNGQMPAGFVVGPNHTIETYIKSQSAPTAQPVSQPAPQPQPPQPTSSKLAASSSQKVTFTPVSYPEIYDGAGVPLGYVNAQGQSVYFNNGVMPPGFSVGPNHTIVTYNKS